MSGILVIAEHMRGELHDITGEMIGAAVSIKDGIGGPLMVAVIGDGSADLSAQANLEGVDEVLSVDVGTLHFDAGLYEEAVCRLGARYRPRAILVGHTVNGMAYAAALAARLGSGFASDVLALDAASGELVATRSAYGNKVNLELGFPGKGVVVLSLRGATFAAPEAAGSAAVTPAEVELSGLSPTGVHVDYEEAPPSDIEISKAEFILSVGRGVRDKDNLPRFAELAERMGATFGCSRPIVDSGWLPKPHQVGQSGKVASNCKLYIALGISGAVQHLFGMKHVDTIIAVNTDPDAPIFSVATYGTTLDLFDLTEALERQFN
ncbi:MAG: electron transfer flavoprotein subunit alpha/FixB family protein [Gammaproteobacteria bacterium]|nr:electron transfer flavoprotein subunit alpha/FixB family protein [Gammaproteobacteria bacterium]